MKKYINPEIKLIAIQTGDIMSLSNEQQGLSISATGFGFGNKDEFGSIWEW